MGQGILRHKEIKFIRGCQQWNGKFEAIFATLLIFTVILPTILLMTMDLPQLRLLFEDARLYSFAVSLGWLITFVNQRWVRIVNKLIQLDAV
jgi:hypothetical protein